VGVHLGVWGFIPSHSPTLPRALRCDSWASFLAHTLASPCLSCEPKVKVATFIPYCAIHLFRNYVIEHIIIVFFYQGNFFFMRLGVIEKAHWYGTSRWNNRVFNVSFDFLFLDFLDLIMFTNILYYQVHFWNVTMGPQITHIMSNACFIFHGWKCYCWSIKCFACDGDIK